MRTDKTRDMETSGYLHAGYPASLTEYGSPVPLSRSGGWLLERLDPGDHGSRRGRTLSSFLLLPMGGAG